MDFTVALAQIKPKLGCLADNLALIETAVERGVAERADVIVFPELAVTGYFLKDLVPEVALALDSPEIACLRNLSRRISIAVGFVEVTSDYRFYNSALYLEDGEVKQLHRKVYLPTYGIFDEARYLAAGDRVRAFDTALGRMAILICEDLWHPAAPAIAAWDGAEILICPSASPGRGLGQAEPFQNATTWERTLRTCGDLLTSYVVYANRVGYEDGACFWGGSEVVTPGGETLAKARYLEEDLLLAEMDPGGLRRARVANPLLRDERMELTLRELSRIIQARQADGK